MSFLRSAGRTGTAYSLFTREELPYALDLHLFLGRRLVPAPRRSISDAAASEKGDVPEDTSLFGTFPLVRCRCFICRSILRPCQLGC